MKLTQRQLRSLIKTEVIRARYVHEGNRDPYHPDYDESEATQYSLRVIEQCKDRLATAIDNVEKLLGSDAEVVQELRDIMFDMHDALR